MDSERKLTSQQASMDALSDAWCNSAIQVFKPVMEFDDSKQVISLNGDENSKVEDGDHKTMRQWKFDDLKSWLWLQQAIHPEVNYDLGFRKKWFTPRRPPWKLASIKKWIKEMKQKRREEGRLQRAEVHAAVSVAGVAAALAAIAAENTDPGRANASKEAAVATAAALVAAQCAQMAEAIGAKRQQLNSTLEAASMAIDTSSIVTLTAAAATSLKGAATLRGRPGRRERIKGCSTPVRSFDQHDFDFGRCRASLAQGKELLVGTPDGECKIRSVSIVLNRDAKVVLKIKKVGILKSLSNAQEIIVYDMRTTSLSEEPPIPNEHDSFYSIRMTTSQGRIELKIDDYFQYKRWALTINHMLMLSTTFSAYELQF